MKSIGNRRAKILEIAWSEDRTRVRLRMMVKGGGTVSLEAVPDAAEGIAKNILEAALMARAEQARLNELLSKVAGEASH